ncbi:MAG: Abi family protein [Christensenellaceae bacterium]|jgi:abortive infection bacteriophage resistance protein|nr:Abi family protein [Christensenellaceae bacterium]
MDNIKVKEYLTIQQQIKHLTEQGLICEKSVAENYLNSIGYFKLINAYRRPFIKKINSQREYIDGTKIQDIHALYLFDKNLQELLLSYTSMLEIDIKAKIIALISEKYGVKEDDWLRAENFRPDVPNRNEKSFIDIKTRILDDIKKQKNRNPAIKHFATTHSYYPFWVATSILTFGVVSQLYSKMTRTDQTQISRQYHILPETLESILQLSVLFRNASAHNNVTYSYKANDIAAKGIKKVYERLSIPKDEFGKYKHGINDLFALIIVLKIMLPRADLRRFLGQFNRLLSIIKRKLPEHIYEIIFNIMNLPPNYMDIVK